MVLYGIHSEKRDFYMIHELLVDHSGRFLGNVLFAVARLFSLSSVGDVCNVRAPYSGGSNFWQYFYGIRYLGHPLTSTENFTEIVPGEPLCRGS